MFPSCSGGFVGQQSLALVAFIVVRKMRGSTLCPFDVLFGWCWHLKPEERQEAEVKGCGGGSEESRNLLQCDSANEANPGKIRKLQNGHTKTALNPLAHTA